MKDMVELDESVVKMINKVMAFYDLTFMQALSLMVSCGYVMAEQTFKGNTAEFRNENTVQTVKFKEMIETIKNYTE